MHGTPASTRALASTIAAKANLSNVVLCPPTVFLMEAAAAIKGSAVKLGAQDCHFASEGAFTGDIGAPMLKSAGCSYVIVGHSERRQYHGETSADVRKKATAADNSGLIPIICVGETEKEHDDGKAQQAVEKQVVESLPPPDANGHFVFAYEPVWAIGSGKIPTTKHIQAMHAHIIAIVARETGLAKSRISVLYGGSVKSTNAKGILNLDGVAGVLVGGASLNAEEFCKIISAAC